MPPLEYVGVKSWPLNRKLAEEEEGDDDMPPLEYMNGAPGSGEAAAPAAAAMNGAAVHSRSDESLPLLEDDDSGDSMPPLDYFKKRAGASGPGAASTTAVRSAPAPAAAATPPQTRQDRQEALLDRMRRALAEGTADLISEAVAAVEAAQGLEWGDMLPKKKALLKKLREKRRKLEGIEGASGGAAVDEAPEPGWVCLKSTAAAHDAAKEEERRQRELSRGLSGPTLTALPATAPAAAAGKHAPELYRLTPRALEGEAAGDPRPAIATTKALQMNTIAQWCEDLQLPSELVDRLLAEEVMEPEELTCIADAELLQLTTGWKMGPKGRFMKAVQRSRAVTVRQPGSKSNRRARAREWCRSAPPS